MSDNPEFETDEQKETVLARCPFIKAFLNKQDFIDEKSWLSETLAAESPLNAELERILGKDYIQTSINPVLTMAQNAHIFNPQLTPVTLFGTVKSIIEVGYEAGNRNDCNVVMVDLVTRLIEMGAFDENISLSELARERTNDTLFGLLSVGIYFKFLSNPQSSTNATHSSLDTLHENDRRLDVFKDFLKGQNF